MTTRPPLVVLDATDLEGLAVEARMLLDEGWSLHDLLDDIPLSTGRVVCQATISGAEAATAAVLAASWGAGLLLAVGSAPPQVLERLLDDLGRIGPVRRSITPAGQVLGTETESLLDLLVEGLSLKAASQQLFLTRRTADRRLAEARKRLGAATTAEALVAWSQHRAEQARGQ